MLALAIVIEAPSRVAGGVRTALGVVKVSSKRVKIGVNEQKIYLLNSVHAAREALMNVSEMVEAERFEVAVVWQRRHDAPSKLGPFIIGKGLGGVGHEKLEGV
ncbi:MAG: hypothetical protein MUF34_26235 [Polyangiaceae bacterium]|nr:hypothetical protein [Polyangiaceae bacterium]